MEIPGLTVIQVGGGVEKVSPQPDPLHYWQLLTPRVKQIPSTKVSLQMTRLSSFPNCLFLLIPASFLNLCLSSA